MKKVFNKKHDIPFVFLVCLIFAFCLNGQPPQRVGISESPMQWHKTILSFSGPETSEEAEPNPFLDYRLDVKFTAPSGKSLKIAGFYAADGNSAESSAKKGNQWKVNFRPDEIGTWSYTVSFVQGTNSAAELSGGQSAGFFDGEFGEFEVVASNKDKKGRDFRGKGTLQYTGEHYFQFDGSKEYYLKGGADTPENFLAYKEFDATYDADAGSGSYSHIGGFIHEYKPHIKDWLPKDPTWQNGKGKGIIGALNYLASKRMNSVYFLTYNLDGGDGRDVWMWISEKERKRFDCSKLDQWEIVFDHMDQLGLMMHVVTQETENDQKLGGSPGLNLIRKIYYRELIARFGHHPALIWNLGEENNTPDGDRKEISTYIRSVDAYNHPITVHTQPNVALEFYKPLLGDKNFEATSIQSNMSNYHNEAVVMREQTAAAGRKWAIFGDEQGSDSHGVLPDENDPTHDIPRKMALWGNLMGGGAGVEWYFGHQFPHMDINCEDWRSREMMWNQTRFALQFFHQYLPFWEMLPADNLISDNNGYCFAKQGQVYAVYLPNGGAVNINLEGVYGIFDVQWYNPRTGGKLVNGSVIEVNGGTQITIDSPHKDDEKDWVVLLKIKA